MNQTKPKIAIIDPNTLSVLGLKHIIEDFMPFAEVYGFGSFREFEANHTDEFFHFFVANNIILEHRTFFNERKHKTFVLTLSTDQRSQFPEFHSICINQPEHLLLHDFLELEQSGHAHGKNFPTDIVKHQASAEQQSTTTQKQLQPRQRKTVARTHEQHEKLSPREIEVMTLIVQGLINKEIADKLNISLPTVITHRKNIMIKLKIKSVSALTIFAVMHGYVDISQI
jgi:DNA-binding CsgD family transcriptional regulator